MARDEDGDRYKEGVDFEWVKAKGSNYRTRRFFSKAEKRARAEKKKTADAATDNKPTGSTKSAPETSPRPKPRPKRKPEPTRGPDDGSRAGQKPNRPVISPEDRLNGVGARGVSNATPAQGTRPRTAPPMDRPRNTHESNYQKPPQEDNPFQKGTAAYRIEEGLRGLGSMLRGDPEKRRAAAQRTTERQEQNSKAFGMNKGGMIMTNKGKVGASMAPTQKKFRTQSRKGK